MASSEKPSHSWWWDSHISPNTSKWFPENAKEMDEQVKQMLSLIETDGDSFAKKAEIYYQKRPQLVSMVEDFYRMYRSLAERYSHLTGELRKSIPSFSDSPEPDANWQEQEKTKARVQDLEKELAESKDRIRELEDVIGAQKERIEILEARLKEDQSSDREVNGNIKGLKIVALDLLGKHEDSNGQFLNRHEKYVITRNRVSVKC